ncbi:YybS family protein [Planococcus lenghuensis]|uniref:DUF2232 domain-containing protein n=1 Tax=Planococcus lenghuensis TaxID=2213202 RepID=A0A1Q2L4C5_9BACL|nr:YybS family protein [Planococcus lenghuensis]AQQ54917.1 hypothetical protein B0X71_18620 [Planococcus lenghuensis]
MANNKTKQLTQGAMMAAIFTVLAAASVYVPVLNMVTMLFLALPVAWYSAKYGTRASLLFSAAATLLTFIIGGLPALPLALAYVPLGLAIGLSIHQKKSKLFLFLASALVLLASVIVQYAAAVLFLGVNVFEQYLVQAKTLGEEFGRQAEELGRLPEGYDERLAEWLFTIEALLPFWLILTVFLLNWLVLLVNLPLLRRLDVPVPKFPPFRNMKLPKSILWYYLVVLLAPYLFSPELGTMTYMAFLNASVLLQVLLFLQGISFYHFYIYQQGWPKWAAILATVLALPLAGFTVIVGIIDLGFNVRGWVEQANKPDRK